MQIALYKGAPLRTMILDPGKLIAHIAICIRTLSKYSHAELVIDGVCWSSSARDGGVRRALVNLKNGHWDVIEVNGDRDTALKWFLDHEGQKYDYWGIAKFVLPFVKDSEGRWFCSEAIAAALGHPKPYKLAPKHLMQFKKV